MFLKEFAPEGVLRRIKLRRGLNVLWAKPPTEDTALFESGGVSGHAAGKTTFCRLLRWVLGEGNFGDDNLRDAVRGKLFRGGVAAEVIVMGTPWFVWREFRKGGHSYCSRDRSLDELFSADLPRAPFSDYTSAVAEVVDPAARAIRLPSSKQCIAWDHVLPWLCRDQECRFATVLEWREPASESVSPSVPASDRSVIVRAVLNTLAAEEEQIASEHATLHERHRRQKDRLPLLQHQVSVEIRRLEAELDRELDAEGPELAIVAVIGEYNRKLQELTDRREALETDSALADAQEILKQATEARRAAEVSLEDDRRQLEIDRLTLMNLRGQVQKDEEERWAALQTAPKGRCNVPLEVAKAKQCPLARARVIDFPTEAELLRDKDQAAAYERSITAMRQDLEQREQALAALKAAEQAAHRAFSQKLIAHNRSLWEAADEEHRCRTVLALAQAADRAQTEALDLPDAIRKLDKKVHESQQALQELRRSQKQAQANFKAWLEWVVQAVLGSDASVSLEQRVDSLRVCIDRSGERNSAAMRTVGVLAFDLAAMLCGCEGQGWHPRLIIHDSPREADLSPDIYRKFFLLAVDQIEASYGDAEPGFQYIVTTTEPPPPRCQQAPWLIDPVLDASTPEGRLFGMDL